MISEHQMSQNRGDVKISPIIMELILEATNRNIFGQIIPAVSKSRSTDTLLQQSAKQLPIN